MGDAESTGLADTVAGWSGGEGDGDGHAAVLERGSAVGRYLVLELLGSGGMGAVYAAYDPQLDRKVALKLVLPGSGGSVGRQRMLREAQAIARLAHPNVVAVHDVGTRVDQVFVAMELVDGVTLRAWLREQPRSTGEILEVFLQAGRGLAAAHKAGLVHRDFKPDNVLVGRDGRTRVVDFGLVREAEHVEEEPNTPVPSERALSLELTLAGSVIGTPAYMAPEQFMRRAADARSDQYSYCVSLFESLSGAVPYSGSDLESTAEKVLAGPIPELGSGRKVPPQVRAAMRRGLSVSPGDRFPSMEALMAELGRHRRSGRRRLAAAAVVLAVAGGAVGYPMVAGGRDGPPPCTGGKERLAGAWDVPQRAALVRSFAATGVPYAADSARAVARSFDRYAGDWVRSWRDSCEATRVRGEQSAEMQDLRAACLARRRSELDALVDLMTAADRGTVQRAAAAAQALPPIAECDDLAALQAPVPPPSGEAARREVDAIRDGAARVDAMMLAGRYKDALAPAEALHARARALAYRPVEAEVGALMAQLHTRSGAIDKAVAAYREALTAAIAGRHDEAVARLLILLVQASAGADDFDRGLEWAALAEAALERIGNPPARRAALHHTHGFLLSRQGKFAEAAAQHLQALAIRERISPTSYETSRSLNSLAFAYDELGRYAEARALAERALAIQVDELGPSHPEIALCYNNLGNIASDEGDFARATDYYRRALAIREQTVPAGDDPAGLGDVLNNLGTIAVEQGRVDEGLDFYRRALEVREKIDPDSLDVSASHANLATVELRQGRVREGLTRYRRALAIAEKAGGRDHPFVGDALQGIGDATRRLGQLDESRTAYERALAIRAAGARPVEVAAVEFGLASTLWAKGDKKRALELARAARDRYAGEPAASTALVEVDAWLGSRPSR